MIAPYIFSLSATKIHRTISYCLRFTKHLASCLSMSRADSYVLFSYACDKKILQGSPPRNLCYSGKINFEQGERITYVSQHSQFSGWLHFPTICLNGLIPAAGIGSTNSAVHVEAFNKISKQSLNL